MPYCFSSITDPVLAQPVWAKLSPHQTLDDDWAFRFSFFEPLGSTLHFVVAYQGEEPIALVPLQTHTDGTLPAPDLSIEPPYFEIFGGDDTDSNTFYTQANDPTLLPQMLEHLPRPAILSPLAEPLSYKDQTATHYTDKYCADLTSHQSAEDYLKQAIGGKTGRQIGSQLRKLYRDHQLSVSYNEMSSLEDLFRLNIDRFGAESSFNWPHRKEIFRNLAQRFPVDIITIKVNGQIMAVSYAIIAHDTYTSMNTGVNNEIRNLGKLLTYLKIDRAITLGLKSFDVGKGNIGDWKSQFAFKAIPQYRLILR